jgi:hypothetical protein
MLLYHCVSVQIIPTCSYDSVVRNACFHIRTNNIRTADPQQDKLYLVWHYFGHCTCHIYSDNFSTFTVKHESRDSVVAVATGYGLDDGGVGVRVPVESRIFSSPRCPYRLWGPPSLLFNGYRGLFPAGVKRPGREADNSPPTCAEVKKMWIYTSIPLSSFMV